MDFQELFRIIRPQPTYVASVLRVNPDPTRKLWAVSGDALTEAELCRQDTGPTACSHRSPLKHQNSPQPNNSSPRTAELKLLWPCFQRWAEVQSKLINTHRVCWSSNGLSVKSSLRDWNQDISAVRGLMIGLFVSVLPGVLRSTVVRSGAARNVHAGRKIEGARQTVTFTY